MRSPRGRSTRWTKNAPRKDSRGVAARKAKWSSSVKVAPLTQGGLAAGTNLCYGLAGHVR